MNAKKVIGFSFLLCVVLAGLLLWNPEKESLSAREHSLVLYCAAGIKPPIEAIVKSYKKEYGIQVQVDYGPSGALLNKFEIAKTGDLYIAADESFIQMAREKGLLEESIPLAFQHPVIAVAKGNPKNIHSITDLLKNDVRTSLANETASIGKISKKVLTQTGQWDALKKRIEANGVFKSTVSDVANDIKLGTVDAGIVWDATTKQYPELEFMDVPELQKSVEQVTIGVLKSCRSPKDSLRFARYAGARDRGLPEFANRGYSVAEGDVWAKTPEITFFSGAMLRVGIEETLKRFQEREGVHINTVYNGCGILVSQMKATQKTGGELPDAYFSCDTSFMRTIPDIFPSPVNVVGNDMVILVAKGNPLKINTMKDLARSGVRLGLRVGLGHPEKSALGSLTKNLLQSTGEYEAVAKNVVVDSATGDFLVNQLRTGALDAIIVYRSNHAFVKEHLDLVEIDNPLAKALQPYAIGKNSKNKQLMGRLLDRIKSAESRERFEKAGFHWKVEAEKK